MNQLKIYLPPPTNWQDFQALLKEIAAVRYDEAKVIEYGTQGQRQNGVDIYAEDLSGKKIGIQCKETKDKISPSEITSEADEAINYTAKLDLFIIATTSKADTKLQNAVIAINATKTYPFIVRIDFWGDLLNDINKYAMVVNACYKTYRTTLAGDDERNHLALLRLAFDRPAFKDDFLYERNYADFEEALVAIKRLFRTGLTHDRWSVTPTIQTIPIDYLPDGDYRRFTNNLEARLEKIYTAFLKDKTKIGAGGQYANERAGHYNIIRRDLLLKLNEKLSASNLDEIDFQYR